MTAVQSKELRVFCNNMCNNYDSRLKKNMLEQKNFFFFPFYRSADKCHNNEVEEFGVTEHEDDYIDLNNPKTFQKQC